jgi:4-hydroxythreonine-4-phosphate dehydrogenase
MYPRIAITTGEPAGIGPDVFSSICQKFDGTVEIIAIGNKDLLARRAATQNITLSLTPFIEHHYRPSSPNCCSIIDLPLFNPVTPGMLDSKNSEYVINTLKTAGELCLQGVTQAICTAPVHKGIINDAGISFSGHTEFFAQQAHIEKVVMMLQTDNLRVALVTTHLPLKSVSENITKKNVEQTINILHHHLNTHCAIPSPKILVAGLNPHAGEDGHLGTEEIEIIDPVIKKLQQQKWDIIGSLPADTIFTPPYLKKADAIVAMYHDQGLPTLKHIGFHNAANITLGLPYIRTSVDHGTALSLAGTDQADSNSFYAALNIALNMCHKTHD